MRNRLIPAAVMIALLLFISASGAEVTAWNGAALNEQGFLDEGTYVLEDPENGSWMYADKTLRICVTRTWETPEKLRERDYNQSFFCYTAEIWIDTERDEGAVTLWADPSEPGNTGVRKPVAEIAREQGAVFAVSTDLFTARVSAGTAGVVIRNGVALYDVKNRHRPGDRPSFDTLAIYADGRVESRLPAEKRAEEYLAEGAVQVYTFGPVLVLDGEIPEEIGKACDRNLNPMHAFGMVEPGHYIDVVCEGRLKKVNGSTGVLTETMAGIMKDRGCRIAVALDGGDTAVMAFMGTQLNRVAKTPSGRVSCEVMAFGAGRAKNTEKNLDTVPEE